MALYAQVACDLPRDPKMLMAGWQARAVYVEAVLFARENLTDGVLLRVALPLWMPDMNVKTRAKHLDRLAQLGALESTPDGWRFPDRVWRKWNPTRSEVEDKREADRQRKAEYRRRKRGEQGQSDDCPDDVPTGQSVAGMGRPRQPEPEPEPEPEPYTGTSSSSSHLAADEATTKRDQIIDAIVTLRADGQPKGTGWRNTVRADVLNRHGAKLDDWLVKFPRAPSDVIAAALESGDSRGLTLWQPTSLPPEPKRISREERDAIVRQAKESKP